jgi:hypothetical protein
MISDFIATKLVAHKPTALDTQRANEIKINKKTMCAQKQEVVAAPPVMIRRR